VLTSLGAGAVLLGGGAIIEAVVYGRGSIAAPLHGPHPVAYPSSPHLTHAQQLAQSSDAQLRLLASYAKDGADVHSMMLNLALPNNAAQAKLYATNTAALLVDWNTYDVAPVIMLSPFGIDLAKFGHGQYVDAIHTYFATLQTLKVAKLGTIVPFPSGNRLPYLIGSTGPEQFVANVNKVTDIIRQYYPRAEDAEISVQLSNPSYLSPAVDSASSSLGAFLPFVEGLRSGGGGVTSLIYSAFPWYPGATSFIDPDVVTGITKAMDGVTAIVLSSGTWAKLVNPVTGTGGPAQFTVSEEQRKVWLIEGVLEPAEAVAAAGYTVSINILTQNNFKKGVTSSATWGYNTPVQSRIFRNFIRRAAKHNIPVTIYDAPND